MPINLVTLIQYGTPVILLGLIITNVYLAQAVKVLQGSVDGIKENITWKGECEKVHAEVNRRLDRLEDAVYGK